MKQFVIPEFGIDNLRIEDRETPRPGVGEVLVKMQATSLNFRDLLVVKGLYNPRMRLPMVPLSDGAGVVEETGPGVSRFKKGDRVTACFMQTWLEGGPTKEKGRSALGGAIDGVLREYAVFSEEGLVHSPATLSDEETAALPCAAVTAWHALFEHRPAAPGEVLLVQGTGGVSLFGLQFGAAAGLRVILTSSSDEKLNRAKALGAGDVINYKTQPDWDEAARKLTGGEGVDHVLEVGGSGTMPRSLKAMKVGGIVSVIGILSGGEASVSPSLILMSSVRVQGIYVGSRAMFERMNRAIALQRIKPVVDKVFPWTDYKEALRHMESQQHFGKICLKF